MRFRDVCHQERAISIIRRGLASGRTHHAYLFDGPEGVGKELTAVALAARLLCEAPDLRADADACGECLSCRLLAAGNHPDFHLVHRGLHKLHPDRNIRSSKGLFLVVDVIRHFLIEPASTSPSRGRRRVFLVRDAERMNEGAQNALLKTLEEPPGSACLILVTASAQRLLPTIRSRCQRVPFDLLPAAFVEEQLTSRTGVAPDAGRALAALSQGRLGPAIRWHQVDLLATMQRVSAELAARRDKTPEAFGKSMLEIATELALRTAETVGQTETTGEAELPAEKTTAGQKRVKTSARTIDTDELRTALKLVFMLIAAIGRDALVRAATGAGTGGILPANVAATETFLQHDPDWIAQRIEAIADAEQMLDRNVAPQLVCERLAVALHRDLPALR